MFTYNQYIPPPPSSAQSPLHQQQIMLNYFDATQNNQINYKNSYYKYNDNNNNNNNNEILVDQNIIITKNFDDRNKFDNSENSFSKSSRGTSTNQSTATTNQSWYSCSSLNIPKTISPYLNGGSDGRSSSAFDSCDSLNRSISSGDHSTIIFVNNKNKRQSIPTKMQLSAAVSLANSYNNIQSTPRNRPKTMNIEEYPSNSDSINNRTQWRSINQFEPSQSRRNTPVMSILNGRLTSPKTAIALSTSSSSSNSSNSTATTSSSADSDSKNGIILPNFSSNRNNYNKPSNYKNRHSLASETAFQQPQTERKTDKFNKSHGLFYNNSLIRKMSLPPDKSLKQLQIYTPDNNNNNTTNNNNNELILNQKPYSNLYPAETNEIRTATPKRESPKFQNKSLNGQTVWAVIKNITDTPSSQMRSNESSSNSSSSPDQNLVFQKADFTPQLHRASNIQQKQSPSVPLRRKQSYETSQQQNQQINKFYKKPTLNEINIRQNCSFESADSIKPTNALTVFAVGQPKNLTRIKYSNENLSMRTTKHEPNVSKKEQQEQISSEKPNFSGLRKFFKDPFENILGKLNNSVNKFGSSVISQESTINDEKVLISVKNSTSNETISNELENEICVEAAFKPMINDSNEKLDKRRKYRTLKSDRKTVK
jgi:hypothetical protein